MSAYGNPRLPRPQARGARLHHRRFVVDALATLDKNGVRAKDRSPYATPSAIPGRPFGPPTAPHAEPVGVRTYFGPISLPVLSDEDHAQLGGALGGRRWNHTST